MSAKIVIECDANKCYNSTDSDVDESDIIGSFIDGSGYFEHDGCYGVYTIPY